MYIETVLEPILGQRIRVHGHDILETDPFRVVSPELKSLCDLSLINAIEEMAVMD